MIRNIVLDFGHGGVDSNGKYTTAPSKMYEFSDGEVAYEGKLNREIGGLLYTKLRSNLNLNVVCTVKEDDSRDLSLPYRVRVANSFNPSETLFISIHCNAGGGSGYEIFTTRGTTNSDKLAESISDSVEELYKSYNLPLRYDFLDGDKDKEIDFYVLRKTRGPAVLLECGFFDNRKDFEILKDSEFQCKLSSDICKGILNYVNNVNQE